MSGATLIPQPNPDHAIPERSVVRYEVDQRDEDQAVVQVVTMSGEVVELTYLLDLADAREVYRYVVRLAPTRSSTISVEAIVDRVMNQHEEEI